MEILKQGYMFVHEHFIRRLKERYNIDITVEEYYQLCKTHYVGLGLVHDEKGRMAKAALVDIKGQSVYVLRDKKKNGVSPLITTLPYSDYLRRVGELGLNVDDIPHLKEQKDRLRLKIAELYTYLEKSKDTFDSIASNTTDLVAAKAKALSMFQLLSPLFKENGKTEDTGLNK